MIGLQSQHTQGASPMKDKKRRHRLTWRAGLIGTLLPMALATSAQTPLRWNVQPAPSTAATPQPLPTDRKSVVSGKSVSARVDLGGRRIIKKTNNPRKI